MTRAALISVIIPFYNIEGCVGYCLDSVLNQDYQGDYEVICIDDGSTDGTGDALDLYAKKTPALKVHHTDNGGQSRARNYGVQLAAGDYVTFVDGDDVVSPYYLSSLADGLRYGENTMVAGTHRKINFSDAASASWQRPRGVDSIDKRDFVRELCYQRMLASACMRLAKRSLYLAHPFPEGRVYEDTYVALEHVRAADEIVLVDGPIYGYVARAGSTVRPKSETMARCAQYLDAIDKFCSSASEYFSESSDEITVFRATELSRLWRRLDVVADRPREADAYKREVRAYIKEHLGQLVSCGEVSRANKARFALLAANQRLYGTAFAAYDKTFRDVAR